MSDAVFLDLDFDQQPLPDPSGDSTRFNKRWHLVGAGLSNVWRYRGGRLD